MSTFIIAIHIIVCVALILIVLLQTGKGADMGAVFGGGSSQTLFGSGGASTFLTKMTTGAAIVFMLTSLSLAYFSGKRPTTSIMPAAPTAPPAEDRQQEMNVPGGEEPKGEDAAGNTAAKSIPGEQGTQQTGTTESSIPAEKSPVPSAGSNAPGGESGGEG
jgi:preprotein translocase subunit SecG